MTTRAADPTLVAEGIVAGYTSELDILNGLTVAIRDGEIVTVVGPNGAGKSTLLKAIVGLLRPKRGRIALQGRDVTGLRPSEIALYGLGYVPQRENIFESMSVKENLEIGLTPRPNLTLSDRLARVFDLFPPLAGRRSQIAGSLSGGE